MANAHSCCQWSVVTWTLGRGGHRRGARQYEAHMRLRFRRIELKRTADAFKSVTFSSEYPRALVTQPGQDNATCPDLP